MTLTDKLERPTPPDEKLTAIMHEFVLNHVIIENKLKSLNGNKAVDEYTRNLKRNLTFLKKRVREKGYNLFINMSSYMGLPEKIILSRYVNEDLSHIKEDFFSIAEQLHLPYTPRDLFI